MSSSLFYNQNRSVIIFQPLKEILHRLENLFLTQTKDGEVFHWKLIRGKTYKKVSRSEITS